MTKRLIICIEFVSHVQRKSAMSPQSSSSNTPARSTPRVRLIDVAREAGVSIATASAVLMPKPGGNTRVGKATADRVAQVARQMQFKPNQTARQLAGKRSRMLGVIIDTMAPEVRYRLLARIEQAVSVAGFRLTVGQAHDNPQAMMDYALDFASRGVEGVFCLAHEYDMAYYDKPESRRALEAIGQVPHTLFLGRPRNASASMAYVCSNASSGIIQACNHLVSQGRQRIALVMPNCTYASNIDRQAGFIQARQAAGIHDADRWVITTNLTGMEARHDERFIRQVIDQMVIGQQADALIAVNDLVAVRLIQGLRKRGLRVPDDVAIIGTDNLQIGEFYEPALTSIDDNTHELCRQAVQAMTQMIQNPSQAPVQIQVEPYLIKRQSA